MTTVLVTGAAGFIGSHVVDALLARGDRVVGVDNFDPYYPESLKRRNLASAIRSRRFELLEADCRDLGSTGTGGTIDVIVHLAARPGVRPSFHDPATYEHLNVDGTQAILNLARRTRVRRIVFASSSSVYGAGPAPFQETTSLPPPLSPYADTKQRGESLCRVFQRERRAHVAALRFFSVFGPRQRPDLVIAKFTDHLLRGEPLPVYGDGETGRDYTWVGDVVSGTLAAIDRSKAIGPAYRAINIGGGRPTTIRALVAMLAARLGTPAKVRTCPTHPGEAHTTWADLSRARRELGYEPRVSLTEGLAFLARETTIPERCAS